MTVSYDDWKANQIKLGRFPKCDEPPAEKPRCRHRDDGRGRCIDCGAFL